MELAPEYPLLLHLSGMTVQRCTNIEDSHEESLLYNITKKYEAYQEATSIHEDKNMGPYDSIPATFNAAKRDLWPSSTNLACWSCTLSFQTPPCFIPTHYHRTSSGEVFGVEGNFCSFRCALRYIDENIKKIEKRWDAKELLQILYQKFHENGPPFNEIQPAPPKTRLTKFGGDMDENIFRDASRDPAPPEGHSTPSSST